ncbi:MAG: S1C family serine protease [Succinivibrio sp.]
MKLNKKILPFLIPAAVGFVVGVIILIISPGTGQRLGDMIYSSGVSHESFSYAVNKAAPSVVNIYVAKLQDDYTSALPGSISSSASGVIMDKNGIIVTNYHVVPSGNEPNKGIFVQLRDGRVLKAFVVGCDRRTDIAVLSVNTTGLTPATVSKTLPNVGDIVLAIGNPNNLGQTVTHGIISALSRSGTGLLSKDQMNIRQGVQDLIQTDAPINQGNSGGALIDTKGNLIGISTATFNQDQSYGIGFALPVKLVKEVMNEILMHGKVQRGYLGISDSELGPLDMTEGVTIGFVDPEGPAFGILKVGDTITQVNGIRIVNVKELIDIISKSKPGSVLTVDFLRDNTLKQESITLKEDNTSID